MFSEIILRSWNNIAGGSPHPEWWLSNSGQVAQTAPEYSSLDLGTVFQPFFYCAEMYTFRNSQKGEYFYETLWLSQNKHEGAASGPRYR